MAFDYTRKKMSVIGDLRLAAGTYTNGTNDTGGEIVTGLSEILYFNTDYENSASTATTLVSISGGAATITTVKNEDGRWLAIGL
jgi:hypothetical protein